MNARLRDEVAAYFRSAIVITFLGCGLMLIPSGVHAADTTPTVTVDLNARSLSDVVPFDVPFALTGTVDATVQRIDAWYVLTDRARGCSVAAVPSVSNAEIDAYSKDPAQAGKPLRAVYTGGAWTTVVGASGTLGDDPRELTYLSTWERNGFPSSTSFRLDAPALRPSRYYCFAFIVAKQLTADALAQFRGRALTALDAKLRSVVVGAVIEKGTGQKGEPPSVYELSGDACRVLQDVAGPVGIQAPSGTLCNLTGGVPADLVALFRLRLVPVYAQQNEAAAAWGDIQGYRLTAGASINAWPTQPFTTAIANLNADAEALKALPEWPSIKEFEGLTPEQRRNLATGMPLAAPLPPAVQPWTAGELTDQVARLDILAGHLRNIQAIFLRVANTPTLLKASGITAVQLDTLIRAVSASQQQSDALRRRLAELQGNLELRAKLLDVMVADLGDRIRIDIPIRASTVGTFKTRSTWYMSLDLGFAAAPAIQAAFPYVGLNLYLRPVNKEAPLQGLQFFRRFALLGGMTWGATTLTKTGQRAAAFGESRMIVAGAGVRLFDHLRFVTGRLIFKEVDPNPFVTRDPTWTSNQFYALSLDWDVAKDLGNIIGSNDER